MDSNSRFEIPPECRDFGEANLDDRRKTAERFVKRFVEKIAPPKGNDTDAAWTQSERQRFIDTCPDGCIAWPGNAQTRKGEFLVDFGWEEHEGERRILLACESEWGAVNVEKTHWRPVETDFEKLLAVKAPFKVLVLSSDFRHAENVGGPDTDFSIGYAKQRLEASLRGYGHNIPGETYIFLDFPRASDGDGIYRSYIWQAKKYGDRDVSLGDLTEGPLVRSAA